MKIAHFKVDGLKIICICIKGDAVCIVCNEIISVWKQHNKACITIELE